MKILETERLLLRDWKESDLDDFFEYASVEGVGEMAGWPHHESKEVSRGILKRFMEDGDVYAIVLKEQNKVIGSLGLHNRTMDPDYKADVQREIGYVLSKAYWGQGLMPEAVRAAIQYTFDELHVDVLWCGHFTNNPQSQRVVKKTGFRFYSDGVYEAKALNQSFDEKKYIMTREDYKASRQPIPMVFDVNQTEFTDDFQREVWKLGIHVVPLDVSLADIADPDTREGCTQVYRCTMEILADMYNSPADYSMARPLDYVLWVFTWVTGKRRVPVNVKKRKGLYEHILGRMRRFGFVLDGEAFTNARYPLFMQYWALLPEGPHLCDFRPFAPNYKQGRTRDDLLRPLPDQLKAYFNELYDYALTKGAKRLPYNPYKLYCFVYKKKHVLIFDNIGMFVTVPYMNQYTSDDAAQELQRFVSIARQQPDGAQLVAYIQQEITLCGKPRCGNPNCHGRVVDIAGAKRHASCCRTEIGKAHRSESEREYTDYDIAMLKRMIDVRILQIDEA